MSRSRLLNDSDDTRSNLSTFPTSNFPNVTSSTSSHLNRDTITPQILQKGAGAGAITAFAFTLNYIFGAGVLSLPYTVARAGVIGSAVFMLFTALISSLSMVWLVEVCGRAEAITRYVEELRIEQKSDSPLRTQIIADRLEIQGKDLFRISSRRLEMNQISSLFLGYWPSWLYSTSVIFYALGSMWFYAVIFARSLTETVPLSMFVDSGDHCDLSVPLYETTKECYHNYFFYLGIFLILTMFLSLFELAEQKKLQNSLSIMAMTCIFIMIITLVVEAIQHPYIAGNDNRTTPTTPTAPSSSSLPSPLTTPLLRGYEPPVIGISIKDFGDAFMNFVLAFMAHHGVPGLIQLMENKKQAPKVFVSAMCVSCSIYLVLGSIAALYFGLGKDGIKSLITLDWYNFNGSSNPLSDGNVFTKSISYIVRLYPCVSVIAAFVLNADTLGSAMRVMLFSNPESQTLKVASRWVIVWISISCAALMTKIAVIVSICGLAGVNLVMVFPSLLQIYSKKRCYELFERHATPYTGFFSADVYPYLMLVFALVTAGLGLFSLIQTIQET